MAKKTKPAAAEASRGKVTALVAGEVMRVTAKAVLVRAHGSIEPIWLPKSQLDREPPRQGGWIDRVRVPRWLARDKELTIEEVVAETSTGQEVRPRARLRGLQGTPRQVDFSPDGSLLAACDDKYDLRMWGMNSGSDWFENRDKCVALPQFVEGGKVLVALRNRGATALQAFTVRGGQAQQTVVCFHESTPAATVVSADGRRLAVGGVHRGTTEGLIQICHIPAQTDDVRVIECEAPVDALTILADGETLAGVCRDGSLRLWNVEDGQLLACAKAAHSADAMYGILYTADGRLISTANDGPTQIWDAKNLERTDSIDIPGASLALAPDGDTLAIGGVEDKSSVVLWDLATGKQLVAIPGHEKAVCSLSFADGGTLLAAADASSTIKVWQIGSSNVPWPAVPDRADTAPAAKPQLPPGSRQLERFKALKGHRAGVRGVEFSADGESLLAWDGDRSFRIWDVDEGTPRFSKRVKGRPHAPHAVFMPGGDQIVTFGDRESTTLVLWSVREKLEEVRSIRCFDSFSPTSAVISPDGRQLAVGGAIGTGRACVVQVGDLVYGEQLTAFAVDGQFSVKLAFSPDGQRLACAGQDGALRIWETEKWEQVYLCQDAHPESANGVLFMADGRTLVSSGGDGVRVWTIGSPEPIQQVSGAAWALALAPDNRTLAIGPGGGTDENLVRLWDLDRNVEIARTGEHYSMAIQLAFSPDGALLAVADQSRTLNIWQVKQRTAKAAKKQPPEKKTAQQPTGVEPKQEPVASGKSPKQPTKKKTKKAPKKKTAKAATKQRHRAPRTEEERQAFEELYEAIQQGDVATVRELIAEGADVDLIDVCGTPPLMLATQTASRDIMRLLIDAGADIEYVDPDGFTPLSWSSYEDRPDLVETLLAAGADPNHAPAGVTALGIAFGHSEASARLLIGAGADVNPKLRKKHAWPFVLRAVNKGFRELVRELIEKGADLNATNRYGWNAWMLAMLLRHDELARLLLERRAERGDENRPKLFHAVMDNDIEQVERLIASGANINAQDPWGKTPLNWCCAQDNAQSRFMDMCRTLLEAGADVNIKDEDGGMPMSYATLGERELFALLIGSGGKISKTAASAALLTACQEGDVKLVGELIGRGANVNKRDKKRTPCILWAAAEGRTEILQLLLDAGADPNLVGQEGITALIAATRMGHLDCMRALLAAGVDLNAKNRFLGRTALLHACNAGEAQAVAMLLAAGADPHVRSRSDADAIGEAMKSNAWDCVWLVRRHIADEGLRQARELVGNNTSPQFFDTLRRKCRLKLADWIALNEREVAFGLIEAGVFADQKGVWDTMPLHEAVQRRDFELTQTLLDAGADIDARDGSGNVTLEYALRPPRKVQLVRLLLDRGAGTDFVHKGFLAKALEEEQTGVVQDDEEEEFSSEGFLSEERTSKVHRDRRTAFAEQFTDRVREGVVVSQAEMDEIVARHANFLRLVPDDTEVRWRRYHLDTPDDEVQMVSVTQGEEHQASFRWVTLTRLQLDGASLRVSNWSCSRLHACEFVGCDLSDSISIRGKATRNLWRNCDLSRNDWSQKSLADNQFDSCQASRIDLDRARLIQDRFIQCDLQHANFQGAHLQHVTFDQCDLREANFRDAEMYTCKFQNCRLNSEVLRWARDYGCVFESESEG